MAIVGAVCIVLGAIGAYLLSLKIVTLKNMVIVVGVSAAGFGCFLVVAGMDIPGWAKYTAAVVAAIAVGFFLRSGETNTSIVAYGTAFIGSLMIAHGLS